MKESNEVKNKEIKKLRIDLKEISKEKDVLNKKSLEKFKNHEEIKLRY